MTDSDRCYFCFYQQKIEWVRLKQNHPDLFEQAQKYEHANTINGEAFYWNGEESLEELERPERMEQIIRNWEKNRERMRERRNNRSLIQILGGMEEEEEEEREGCLICSI